MDDKEIARLKKRADEAVEVFRKHVKLMELFNDGDRKRLMPRHLDLMKQNEEAQAALTAALAKQRKSE